MREGTAAGMRGRPFRPIVERDLLRLSSSGLTRGPIFLEFQEIWNAG
jgi:hypothetical protein